MALTGEEVYKISHEVTVLISIGDKPSGSGVIVAKSDKTYYVLTANHVVDSEADFRVVTPDQKTYKVDYSKVKHLPGADLAVLEFTSEKEYKIAKLANSDNVKEGTSVFVSGWPKADAGIPQVIPGIGIFK
jgi:serine protease Do